MAMPHAGSGEVVEVVPAGVDLTQFSSIALARTEELELIRLVLPEGKVMPQHHVPGELTLHCLVGEVVLEAHGGTQRLAAGQMVYLHGGQAHALRAECDSVVLLTMLLVARRAPD